MILIHIIVLKMDGFVKLMVLAVGLEEQITCKKAKIMVQSAPKKQQLQNGLLNRTSHY